jgi:hypothetical protein
MPWLPTLHAPKKLKLGLGILFTSFDLQTPDLFVPVESASIALNDIRLRAVDGQVSNFVTFEADLLSALERVMRVFAAENAGGSFCLVWTVTGPVAALTAVFASEQRILAEKVP